MKTNRRNFLGTTAAAAGILISKNSWAADAKSGGRETIANATTGKLRGAVNGKVHVFKGVPYGASTEGARFLPPSPMRPWTGVRDALELGPAAPQFASNLVPESMAQQPADDAKGTEDCLRLNIFTPSTSGGKRPVMVWFHGGGYSAGSGNWAMYDGTNLAAKHDVVVVTVNHRLNVFGYLHLADLGGAKFAQFANVGMLDCIQALQWVHDNAANFGGDANNVTIFGQSGGGGKVSTLMAMPGAKGLFHRAIAMSGSNVNGQPRDRANQGVEAFLSQVGLKAGQGEELQKMPALKLLEAMRTTRGLNLSPVIDPRTLPAGPFNPTASEFSASVPFMTGSTETEITWNVNMKFDPIDDAMLRERAKGYMKVDDAAIERLIAVYKKAWPKADNLTLALIMGSDVGGARTGTDTEAERKVMAKQAPTYKYYFQWYSPVRGGALRSYHTLDIPFVFRTADIAQSMTGDGKDRYALEDVMSAAFVAFARTGNPNTKGVPKWEPFSMEQRGTMIFNNQCRFVNDPYKEQRLARIAEKVTGTMNGL